MCDRGRQQAGKKTLAACVFVFSSIQGPCRANPHPASLCCHSRCPPVLRTLRLLLQDDPDWYTAEDEKEEDAGEGELYQFGQECLDRISLALGGKTLVPLAGA